MFKNKFKVSIVIPHWNGISTLKECLNSIFKSKYKSFEVIIVDNASSDGSQDWIKNTYPDIILVENAINQGYAGGCNIGAKKASGELLVFLNNDTIHDTNWIEPLLKIMDKDKKIAAVQPKILNYYNKNIFDYAGGAGGSMDIYCFPFARGRIFSFQEHDSGQYEEKEQCFWASGTALMVRKTIFFKAGKFDETFFAHMEEIDLCWRFQAMGYQVWVEPKSVVFHKNALSLPMKTHRKYYFNHRNSLLMLFSNYSFSNAFYFGTLRIFFEIIAILFSLLKLDWNHLTGIVRSLFWILFNPMVILRKREHFNSLRKYNDKEIMKTLFKKSIIISYFLKRHKTYLDIESNIS